MNDVFAKVICNLDGQNTTAEQCCKIIKRGSGGSLRRGRVSRDDASITLKCSPGVLRYTAIDQTFPRRSAVE